MPSKKSTRCAKSIVFINKKGGVGKTTSVVTIASYLSSINKTVLIIDCDSQANSTTRFLTEPQIESTPSLYDMLSKNIPWQNCLVQAEQYPNIAVIPGSLELDDASGALKRVNQALPQIALEESLKGVKKHFDYIFFDCAPNTGILNQAALVAGDSFIIPTDCTTDGLCGADVIVDIAKALGKLSKTKYLGLLICSYEKENSKHMQEFRTLLEGYKDHLIKPKIPATSYIPAAGNKNKTIFDTHPNHKASKAFIEVTKSVIL
ncbi:MAG: ParA family protein [Oligoflexales bacterium]